MVSVNEIKVNSLVVKSRLPVADYVINPYVGCPHKCIYCYAEFMRRFTFHRQPWGDFLDVKRCGRKFDISRLAGARVSIGSVTDGYNPFEKKYRVTRGVLEQFVGSSIELGILTKSALVLRDIDLLRKIPHVSVGFSINTLDESVSRVTEPRASSIARRLDALRKLHEAGIGTWVFVSPIFPGLTDFRKIVDTCRVHADYIGFENLNLRGGYYSRVMQYIEDKHPGLLPLYEEIYRRKRKDYWVSLEREILAYCKERGVRAISYFYHEKIRKNEPQNKGFIMRM